jgi:predicted nucleic acid-binding protein
MRVVVNTSPLLALERIGQLQLLKLMYGVVVRPQSVLDEIDAGRGTYDLSPMLENADWIVTEPDPVEMVLRRELGAGETAAIALAVRSRADLVILDDLQARFVAQAQGLALTGTLGVLIAAARAGYLADLKGSFRQLQEAGFRIPAVLMKEYGT